MIRRAILVAAAAVALILAPSVAMAYGTQAPTLSADYSAPGYSSVVSDSTPAVGQDITVTIDGGVAHANQVITLTITGPSTRTLTATANAAGVATFTFSLSPAGDYTLTATDASGALISTQTVTVHAAGAAGVPPSTDQLSFTGSNVLPLVTGGGLLVLAGAGAVLIARRRKSAAVPA